MIVGAAAAVDLGELGDQRRRRVVVDEADGELARDPARGRRVRGEVAEVGDRDLLAVRARVGVAEVQDLHPAGRVLGGVVEVLHRAVVDGEAGQQAGSRLHHRLGVAGLDADGVQLEQLAGVVLVRRVLVAVGVVEVGEHRRVPRRRDQHVAELPEGVLADHLQVVEVPGRPDVRRRARHVEVVGPEVDHRLEQLPVGPRGACDVGVAEVEHRVPLEAADRSDELVGRHPQGGPPAEQAGHAPCRGPATGAAGARARR